MAGSVYSMKQFKKIGIYCKKNRLVLIKSERKTMFRTNETPESEETEGTFILCADIIDPRKNKYMFLWRRFS